MRAHLTPLRVQSSTKPLLGMNGNEGLPKEADKKGRTMQARRREARKPYLPEAALSAWALLRAVSSRCMAATVSNISS